MQKSLPIAPTLRLCYPSDPHSPHVQISALIVYQSCTINRSAAQRSAGKAGQPPAAQWRTSAALRHSPTSPFVPFLLHIAIRHLHEQALWVSCYTFAYPSTQIDLPLPFAARHHKRASSTTLTSIPYQTPTQWTRPSLTITASLLRPVFLPKGSFGGHALRNITASISAPFPCWAMVIGELGCGPECLLHAMVHLLTMAAELAITAMILACPDVECVRCAV
jgi:hypothetical protein